MKVSRYAETLSSHLNVQEINKFFVGQRQKTEEILRTIRPEGRIDGNRFKLASVEGGIGSSFDFNLTNHHWGDWATNSQFAGLIGFIQATQKCSAGQAVQWMIDKKFFDAKTIKKKIAEAEGNPLVLPIPEDVQSWEYVLKSDGIKKDRGIISHQWEYRDTDGQLLGYQYRVDGRRSSKEIYTLTWRAETGWTKREWDGRLLPPYGLEQLGAGRPIVRVLFVEGNKAVDRARELLGDRWIVLGFSGVRGSENIWLPDDEWWGDVEVVVWPDNDAAGRESARKIQLKLESLKTRPREIRVVRVEDIPGLKPKWDIGDWSEGCGVDVEVEIDRAQSTDSFEHICKEWIYVSQQDHFYSLVDRTLVWTTTAFDRTFARFKTKQGSPSQRFLMELGANQADDLDFVPGHGTIIVSPNGKRFLNEYYPSETMLRAQEIASDEEISDEEIQENAREFIAHVRRISNGEIVEPDRDPTTGSTVPGTENRTLEDAILWHFSQMIQRPMDKRGWIPMMVSQHNGTGKSYFKRMMGAILGHQRTAVITAKELIGDYHDWADGVLFYELGEAKSEDSTDVYEELKKRHSYLPFRSDMLRDRTQNTQYLNIKTKAKKRQRDFLNGYITSNNLFPLALANTSGQEGSDRRLLVIRCEIILSEEETIRLFDEELAERAEWIAAYLLRYRAKFHWNPSWAPITAHKRAMLEKDRQRSEVRQDRTELGRFDEFFHLVRWALAEGVGALRRKVFTADVIREIADARRVKYPYDVAKFEGILKKAGVHRGPVVKIDGHVKKFYTSDETWLERPETDWREEHKSQLNSERM